MIFRLSLVFALCAGLFAVSQSGGSLVTKSHAQFDGCGPGFCTPPRQASGGTLTFAIDPTNFSGNYATSTMPLVCPSAACNVSGSSTTQYGIGAASANRVAAVAFAYVGAATSANGQITGVQFNGTISGSSCTGGTAATRAFDSYPTDNAHGQSVWYASLSTGTTATVCFTAVGGNGWGNLSTVTVFTMTDSLGAGHITVSSTIITSPPAYPGSCASNVCTNNAGTVTVPSGGLGVYIGYTADGTFPSSSWTGTGSPTKQAEPHGPSSNAPLATSSTTGTVTETVNTSQLAGFAAGVFSP
jgi:hypothetical protein